MTSSKFRGMLKEAREGKILTPLVRAALTNPDFEGFTIDVEGWEPRPYDGWFHPSTHATWTARQLAYYLLYPEAIIQEKPSLLFVLAVTQGKFWHKFFQQLFLAKGVLTQAEVPLSDASINCTGHADGQINDGDLWEFKTMSHHVIRKVKTVEDLVEHDKFGYYAQTQDYLMMSGNPRMRYLIMALASPFDMSEMVVEADPLFQAAQREKYHQAITAALTGEMPPECCTPRSPESRTCPARRVCPLGAKDI